MRQERWGDGQIVKGLMMFVGGMVLAKIGSGYIFLIFIIEVHVTYDVVAVSGVLNTHNIAMGQFQTLCSAHHGKYSSPVVSPPSALPQGNPVPNLMFFIITLHFFIFHHSCLYP